MPPEAGPLEAAVAAWLAKPAPAPAPETLALEDDPGARAFEILIDWWKRNARLFRD